MRKSLRKILVLLLILLAAQPAAANEEAGIEITRRNVYLIPLKTPGICAAHVYARFDNTGDAPVCFRVSDCTIQAPDTGKSASPHFSIPLHITLAPGEYLYGASSNINTSLETDGNAPAECRLTVTTLSPSDVSKSHPCEGSYRTVVSQWKGETGEIRVSVNNTTGQDLTEYVICFALLDKDDNILFAGSEDCSVARLNNNSVILPAGTSLTLREEIDSSILAFWETQGLEPSRVDCFVFYQ